MSKRTIHPDFLKHLERKEQKLIDLYCITITHGLKLKTIDKTVLHFSNMI